MSEAKERADFARRHAGEMVELVVLTGKQPTSGARYSPEILWTARIDLIAHRWVSPAPEAGGVREGGALTWLYSRDDADTKSELRPLTIYRVRGQRADPDGYAHQGRTVRDLSGTFWLLEVLEQAQDAELAERLASYQVPVLVESRWGRFTLDRSLETFDGTVDWVNGEIAVSLAADEDPNLDGPECQAALATLDQLMREVAPTDAAWRAKAADDLMAHVSDWSDDDSAPRSAAELANRFRLSELAIDPSGEITAFYSDGGVFGEHMVLLEVEPDGSLGEAYLAG